MDLRFLGKVLQGALIGLGAVLPGISGGVLSVVFGVYRPIMELLSDPVHKWRTHLPELFPYMIGSAAGFLGVANLLSYVLETAECCRPCGGKRESRAGPEETGSSPE